jgi:hypothetical protein
MVADIDGNGKISVQEAVEYAEEKQRTYMHEVVFAVPDFVKMYHDIGAYPDQDQTFPDVILIDGFGEEMYLNANQ